MHRQMPGEVAPVQDEATGIDAGEDNGAASEAEPTEEKDAKGDAVGEDVGAVHVKEARGKRCSIGC